MKRTILIASVILINLIVIFSCRPAKLTDPRTSTSYDYEVAFIRTGVAGTELFKVFSYGRSERECIEASKLNAIKAILFKGIPGSGMQRPMISEAGAEEKYKEYFNEFFKSGGQYLNFVALSTDGSIDSRDRIKVQNGKLLKIGIVVSVQKDNLRKRLQDDKIIKSLSSGF
ncbi:MAG: hypothetical protein RIR48_2912 [Bacteroidota bacterium]